jgi:protein TonB
MDATLTWPAAPARRGRPLLSGAVLALHVLAAWALLNLEVVQRAVEQAAPLVVRIVSPDRPPEPERPLLAAPPQVALPTVLPVVPPVEIERPAPPPPIAVQVVSAPVATPPPPVPAPVAVTPPPPPPPAAPLKVAASQLRYLVEPPIEVPRASRRLREQGTVVVHVLVDVQGLPRQVSLAKSSGFDRLDQQALGAMRQARFVPCSSNGKPVECESDAPFVYELEN